MALAEYKPASQVFTANGSSFTVKGLSLIALTKLIRHHLEDAEAVYDLVIEVMAGKTEFTEEVFTQVLIALLEHSPTFVANVIALAADEDNAEAIAAAGTLDFAVQLKVIVAISDLTFSEVGGIKKGIGMIVALLKTSKTAVPEIVTSIRS
jgi:hypothetical protein